MNNIFRTLSSLYLWREFIFTRALVDRSVSFSDRALGGIWHFISPLADIMIYYILIVVIFNTRDFYGVPPFLGIVVGIVHFLTFQRIVSSNLSVFLDNRDLLLQINIPPISFLAARFLNQVKDSTYYFIILAGFFVAYEVEPKAAWLLYPLLVLAIFLVAWSFSLLLATLYVFYRDINEIMSVFLRVMMYSAPVVYSTSFIPPEILNYYFLNPFAVLFAIVGAIVFEFPFPPVEHTLIALVFFVVIFFTAHAFYHRNASKFTKVM